MALTRDPDSGALRLADEGRDGGAPPPLWVKPLAVGAVVACGCAAIALVDPGDGGTPVCWSKAVLGIDCPFCGGLRCTNALLRGDWLAAADHNVLLAVVLPILAIAWAVWTVRALMGRETRFPTPSRPVVIGVALALVAFTVVRNVDGAPWIDWLASGSYRS